MMESRNDRPLSIAMNATAMLSPLTGVGRYVKELSSALVRQGVDVCYFNGYQWVDTPPQAVTNDHISTATKDVNAGFSTGPAYRFFRQLIRRAPGTLYSSRMLQQRRFAKGLDLRNPPPALYHEPNYLAFRTSIPSVVTAHDASWVRYPETHPLDRIRMMERYLPAALNRAQRVIVDSDFVAREMHEIFSVPYERMRTVPLGVSAAFQPLSSSATQAACQRLGVEHGRYVLSVGTLEPRKNLLTLIQAYRAMPSELTTRYPLAIAGIQGWRHKNVDHEISALERAGKLRLLGHVDEADLPALYAAAAVFAYPSFYEGFGLPPLEAMKSGVPVVVADCSSLPEVVGDAGKRVAPHDVDALAETLRNMLEDQALRERMGAASLERASHFTWDKCAQQTLDVYLEAITR